MFQARARLQHCSMLTTVHVKRRMSSQACDLAIQHLQTLKRRVTEFILNVKKTRLFSTTALTVACPCTHTLYHCDQFCS